MTVAELIELLQKQDPTLTVYRHDYDYGPDPVTSVQLEKAADMNRIFWTLRTSDFLVIR